MYPSLLRVIIYTLLVMLHLSEKTDLTQLWGDIHVGPKLVIHMRDRDTYCVYGRRNYLCTKQVKDAYPQFCWAKLTRDSLTLDISSRILSFECQCLLIET